MRDPSNGSRWKRWFALWASSLLVLSGCSLTSGQQARDKAQALAKALEAGDISAVEFSNGSGPQVQAELEEILAMTGGIQPRVEVQNVQVNGEEATAELSWQWDLPTTDEDWTYTSSADLSLADRRWQPTWTPSMVEPTLEADDALRIQTIQPRRGEILGTDDAPLAMEQPVHRIGLDLTAVPAQKRATAARDLARAVDIDPQDYTKQVTAAADGTWVQAIVLREEDFRELDAQQMQKIPGLQVHQDRQVLTLTKGFAAETLGTVVEATAEDIEKSGGTITRGTQIGRGGIQEQFEETLHGEPGVVVDKIRLNADGSVDPRYAQQLDAHAPEPGQNVHTTLDANLQQAAETALEGIESPSSVVLMRPSDGAVLAVANGEGSKGYPTATQGQYAPGSTFKIATSLAMLRAGDTPETLLECPHALTIAGTQIANFSGYPAQFEGPVSLRNAIAHSCNTVFAAQNDRISQPELADAAEALGIGVEMEPGIPVFSGTIPDEEPAGEHVAAMFGQGRTLVSPLGMARFQASAQAGKVVNPVLIRDQPSRSPEPQKPLSAPEAADLQTLMREVVATGHLKDLRRLAPDTALGKTGTAEYGNENPPRTHSWVIAGHKDLAAAVFVEDGDLGSITGTPIMRKVLEAGQATK